MEDARLLDQIVAAVQRMDRLLTKSSLKRTFDGGLSSGV
jgi:hypothetical protein